MHNYDANKSGIPQTSFHPCTALTPPHNPTQPNPSLYKLVQRRVLTRRSKTINPSQDLIIFDCGAPSRYASPLQGRALTELDLPHLCAPKKRKGVLTLLRGAVNSSNGVGPAGGQWAHRRCIRSLEDAVGGDL